MSLDGPSDSMATSTVGIQRRSEPGDGPNRAPVISDRGPLMVHAGTQTGGHGYGHQHPGHGYGAAGLGVIGGSASSGSSASGGPGSTVLGKTRSRSSLTSGAAASIHGGVTNRELREYSRRSQQAAAASSVGTGSTNHGSHGAGASSINPRRAAKIRHRSSSSNTVAPATAPPPPPPPAVASTAAGPSGGLSAQASPLIPPPPLPLPPPPPPPPSAHPQPQSQSQSQSPAVPAAAAAPHAAASSSSSASASSSSSAAAAAAAAAIIGGIPQSSYYTLHYGPGNNHLHHHHHHHQQGNAAQAAVNSGFTFPHQTHSGAAAAAIHGRQTPGTITPLEMDPPVLSFWGTDPVPLPNRFARIKRKLVAGHEAELSRSWAELINALHAEVRHIEELGPHLIPSVQFAEIDDPAQCARFSRHLKRYGVGVVRGVVPKADAESYVHETVNYLKEKKDFKPPPVQDPTCFDFFWTPAQVRTRAHPKVLRAQRFMMGLWETGADDKVATKYPITYADRIRIHGLPGYKPPAPAKDEMDTDDKPKHPMPARSADDWLNAIQSSTIIAQVDNGSLERWEPDGYQRSGIYDRVFKGEWDAYDPWECGGRVNTTTDLYNGYGVCSMFRMFQGLLALSTIEPGMVRILPSPKLVTAYFLLRPFFSPKKPCPDAREGPEWDAYLHPDNWALDKEQNTIIHGAVPGHAQRVTELWHPHLHLRRSLITLPTLQAGDYIFWHPDLAYHITSDGTGLRSDNGNSGVDDVRMLVYLPAAPLTQTGALYLARQRKMFLRGQPGPDFDSTGSGLGTEGSQGRLGKEDIAAIGGPAALQSMGLAPYEVTTTPRFGDIASAEASSSSASNGKKSPAPVPAVKNEDVEMENDAADSKSVKSTSSSSQGEAEVVRLANLILFPDECGMGFPQKEGNGSSSGGGATGNRGPPRPPRPGMKEAATNTSPSS